MFLGGGTSPTKNTEIGIVRAAETNSEASKERKRMKKGGCSVHRKVRSTSGCAHTNAWDSEQRARHKSKDTEQ
jgi:hypothetical protein